MDRLLIVDDDPRLRLMLREQLELAGFAVDEAPNGTAALQRVREQPDIALVLLDVVMPAPDGLTVLRELRSRENTARLPVILLTARSQMGEKLQGLDLGADDYITKPFDTAELLARIRVQLRLRRLTLEVEEQNEELQRFAAAVAHEVRAPLNELALHIDQAGAEASQIPATRAPALAALTRRCGVLPRCSRRTFRWPEPATSPNHVRSSPCSTSCVMPRTRCGFILGCPASRYGFRGYPTWREAMRR